MQDYESFWKPLISNADDSLNEDQIARELADYRDLMRNVSEVYCAVTGERIGKVNTLPEAVIQVANERVDDLIGEAIDDLITELEDRERFSYSAAEVVAAIRETTGHATRKDDQQ